MFKELVKALSINRIDYLFNDPSTPQLKASVAIPSEKTLKFGVKGWNGKGTTKTSLRAGRCFVTVADGIGYLQDIRKKQKTKLVQRWPATAKLSVDPEKNATTLNAYYNRKALCFFSKNIPGFGFVSTADSVDIVAHELGHALLDAQRPDFWHVQALEIWSFHEAYADITAVATVLQHKQVREYVIAETAGDIRKANVASRLAEQMGAAIYSRRSSRGGYYPDCLRDATIKFAYKRPSQLPRNAPHNKLCAECHSFGRIFLGAWYEIMVGFYELNCKNGLKAQIALRDACDTAFSYLVKALCRAPRVGRFYQAISGHFLSLCSANEEHYQIVKRVLAEYDLIKPKIMMLQNKVSGSLANEPGEIRYVHVARQKTIRLSDYLADDVVQAFAVDTLANVELEVPNDSYYEFDENGTLIEEIGITETEIVEEARLCAAIIQSTQQVGPQEDKMWEIRDNKLERSFIE